METHRPFGMTARIELLSHWPKRVPWPSQWQGTGEGCGCWEARQLQPRAQSMHLFLSPNPQGHTECCGR